MRLTSDPALRKAIEAARKKFFEKKGLDYGRTISADLVHGGEVALVGEEEAGKIISKCDGLASRSKNIYLALTVADCLPIFFFDPARQAVGLAHAGWRGLRSEIILRVVEKMVGSYGCRREDILAGIGPGICAQHYEVGPEMIQEFGQFPEAFTKTPDKLFLDLKKIAFEQLRQAGLKETSIETSPACTYEDPERYFSYRREKKEKIEAMVAAIGIKE